MGFLLTIAAVILAVCGFVLLVQGRILWGLVLFVLACAVGPGGWSLLR